MLLSDEIRLYDSVKYQYDWVRVHIVKDIGYSGLQDLFQKISRGFFFFHLVLHENKVRIYDTFEYVILEYTDIKELFRKERHENNSTFHEISGSDRSD